MIVSTATVAGRVASRDPSFCDLQNLDSAIPSTITRQVGARLKTVGTIQRVAQGDPTAVEQCIAQYGGLVWTLARRMTISNADAEDAVQEIFLQLWQQAERFDASLGSEANFVTMIARRRLIDRLRKTQRRPKTETLLDAPPATEKSDVVAIAEEAAFAREKMNLLKPDEQRVLELTLQEGLPQTAVADKLNLPLGTVKSHARRGMIRLRELMGVVSTSASLSAEKGGVS